MNRRGFLWALAAACTAPAAPRETKLRKRHPPKTAWRGLGRWSRPRLAMRGEMLVHRAPRVLQVIDSLTMTRTRRVPRLGRPDRQADPLNARHAVEVSSVLEHGDIQFWFRPSVQPADADKVELGVQAFYAVLTPAGGKLHRRVRIGKKRMPARSDERFWARVERVGTMQRVLGGIVDDEQYTTKTRGERYQPGARPIASGTYELVQEEDHVRLAYTLDRIIHDDDTPPVEDGSHLVLFEAAAGASATWTTTGGPQLLDEEGAEIVLVGAKAVHRADDAMPARREEP